MTTEKSPFQPKATLLDVVVIGVGSAIGVSIFAVLAPVAEVAGRFGLIALLLAAIPMALFSFIYAFMTSAAPASGASYLWPSRFISPFTGFMIAWLRILGSTGAIVQHGVIFVQYVVGAFGWHLPVRLTMVLLLAVFYLLNVLGISLAARAQLILTAVLIGVLAWISFASSPHLSLAHVMPTGVHDWSLAFTAVPLLVGLFIGVEFAAEIGEEVKNARRTIAVGLGISGVIVLGVYVAVTTTAFSVLGVDKLAHSEAPILDVAREAIGPWIAPVIIVAALSAIAASLNGTIIIFSRFLFAMSRSGGLPSGLDRIHPRFGTPHWALTAVFVLSLVGVFLPNSLVFLFLAVNIPTMLKYAANCISAINIVRKHPDVYGNAVFRPSKMVIICAAVAGLLCACLIVGMGLKAAIEPYIVLVIWAAFGMIVWVYRRRRSAVVSVDLG